MSIYLGDEVKAMDRFIPNPTLDPYLILTADEIELLTQLQHYGGETNLIDFTTDYLIAIFFACTGEPGEDGRVIILKRTDDINNMMIRPQNPECRVIGQKSVFLHPPEGFIDVPENKIVTIPFTLKRELLMYLRQYHNVSTETIYNDIHGFIRNQNIHQNSYVQFCLGLTCQRKGYHAEPDTDEHAHFTFAIEYYNNTILLAPEMNATYGNRAECFLHLEEWDNARRDFTTAKNMGLDIVSSFNNDYKDVAAFEDKTGFTVPQDIAEMLGG